MQINYPSVKSDIQLSMVQDGDVASFKKICATNAGFDMSGSELERFAEWWGIDLGPKESLPHLFFVFITDVLKTKPEKTLEIISQRLAVKDLHNTFVCELLQIDEAISFIDHNDQSDIKQHQDDAKKEIERRVDFTTTYASLYEVHGIKPPAKEKGVKYAASLEQEVMKQFIPPGSSIWRGLTHRCTCGHMPPRKRISSPWDVAGEIESVRDVTRRLWEQYLELKSLPRDFCWVQGLWDD